MSNIIRILPMLLLVAVCISVVLGECHPFSSGKLLDCTDIHMFPNGSFSRVKILRFSKNNFPLLTSYVFVDHGLYNLEKAILRHSNIKTIEPYAFSNMSHLSYLDLYGNNLTVLHRDCFVGLSSLKHLQLNHNQISSFDAGILKPLLSLTTIDLSFNRIHVLPIDVLKNTIITELRLSGNPIQFTNNDSILESSSLLKLTLQLCKLSELPENAFNKLPRLMVLDLSRNFLDGLSSTLLKPLGHLKVLDMRNNSMKECGSNKFSLSNKIHILCDSDLLEDDVYFFGSDHGDNGNYKKDSYAAKTTTLSTTNLISYHEPPIKAVSGHHSNEVNLSKNSADATERGTESWSYKALICVAIVVAVLATIVLIQTYYVLRSRYLIVSTEPQ